MKYISFIAGSTAVIFFTWDHASGTAGASKASYVHSLSPCSTLGWSVSTFLDFTLCFDSKVKHDGFVVQKCMDLFPLRQLLIF